MYLYRYVLHTFPPPHTHTLSLSLFLPLLVRARAAEAAGAAHAFFELGDLNDLGRVDALDDELGHAVALCHGEVSVGMVEQEHLDLAPVVGVDDASARVDEVFGGEAATGGDTTVCLVFKLGRLVKVA